MKNFFLVFFFVCSFSCKLSAQDTEYYSREKVHLITDREVYSAGETIWFSTFLVDESLLPSKLSTVVHVDLIQKNQNRPILKAVLQIKNGFATADFQLPNDLSAGQFSIVAYTIHQLNYNEELLFKKELVILTKEAFFDNDVSAKEKVSKTPKKADNITVKKEIDLQFFIEGGDFISATPSKVAFKAIDNNGKGTAVSGEIRDAENNVVSTFESTHMGMGVFYLLPEKNQEYKAVLTSNQSNYYYPLPKVEMQGHAIKLKEANSMVVIRPIVVSNDTTKKFLFAYQRGKALYKSEIEKSDFPIAINTENLSSGIIKFIITNEEYQPLVERQYFHFSTEQINFSEQLASVTNAPWRANQTIDINEDIVKDGTFSLKVVDERYYWKDSKNILTNLLLESDLAGTIEEPYYYFDIEEPFENRKNNIDLVMLTHGWANFETNNRKILPETEGINLTFLVKEYKQYSDKITPVESSISMTALESGFFAVGETSANGTVTFKGLNIYDSTKVILKANKGDQIKPKKKAPKVIDDFLVVDRILNGPNLNTLKEESYFIEEEKNNLITEKIQTALENDWRIKVSNNDILIEEVIVTATRDNKRFQGSLLKNPSRRVLKEDVGEINFPGEFLIMNSGVRVIGSGANMQVLLRGNQPLFLLDNLIITQADMMDFPVFELDYVDIIKPPQSFIYGGAGLNGVIAFYTKKGGNVNPRNRIIGKLELTLPGYTHARQYYNPMFTTDELEKKPFSATLHWEPNVTKDVSFSTPNFTAKYYMIIEGITATGEPIMTTKPFYVYE